MTWKPATPEELDLWYRRMRDHRLQATRHSLQWKGAKELIEARLDETVRWGSVDWIRRDTKDKNWGMKDHYSAGNWHTAQADSWAAQIQAELAMRQLMARG